MIYLCRGAASTEQMWVANDEDHDVDEDYQGGNDEDHDGDEDNHDGDNEVNRANVGGQLSLS